MRFGFLLKRGKPEAREIAAELGSLLRAEGSSLVALAEDADALPGRGRCPRTSLAAPSDALVVLGGDGTFLFGAAWSPTTACRCSA